MFKRINFIRSILIQKNRQIKAAQQTAEAFRSMNVILSAYIAILAERRGRIVIPKHEVSEALGKFRVSANSDGGNYIIEVVAAEKSESPYKTSGVVCKANKHLSGEHGAKNKEYCAAGGEHGAKNKEYCAAGGEHGAKNKRHGAAGGEHVANYKGNGALSGKEQI